MSNQIREAFYGGEQYFCAECGAVLVTNQYPTTETGTSARRLVERIGADEAALSGVRLGVFTPCGCD